MMEPLVFRATAPESESLLNGLSIKLIRRRLCTDTVGFQLYLFRDVPSTNLVLRRLAEAGVGQGAVVLAEAQRAGRGRLGKSWFSPPDLNLYASVLFRPQVAPHDVPVFTFIASLALSEAVRAEGLPAGIKWPNDVLVGGRKVAGTLAACSVEGDRVEYVVLGVGVNLNVEQAALRAALGPEAEAAGSLREAAGRPIDRNAFTATFLNLLEKWFKLHGDLGPLGVLGAWRQHDVLRGRRVEVRSQRERYQGRVIGVDEEGRLGVEDVEGQRHRVVAAEILIRD